MGKIDNCYDFTGKNKLYSKVIRPLTPINGLKYTIWELLCQCGVIYIANGREVKSDVRRNSCGCKGRTNEDLELKGIRSVLWIYQKGAAKRNVSFCLTFNEFRDLIYRNCHYCGSEKFTKFIRKYANNSYEFLYTGIDKINPKDGYTLDNCIPCCVFCNRAKWNYPIDEFLRWIERLRSR